MWAAVSSMRRSVPTRPSAPKVHTCMTTSSSRGAVGEIGDKADLGGDLRVGDQQVEHLEALVAPGAGDGEELGTSACLPGRSARDAGGVRRPGLVGDVPGDDVRQGEPARRGCRGGRTPRRSPRRRVRWGGRGHGRHVEPRVPVRYARFGLSGREAVLDREHGSPLCRSRRRPRRYTRAPHQVWRGGLSRRRLSPLDGSFLRLESSQSHMHVVVSAVFAWAVRTSWTSSIQRGSDSSNGAGSSRQRHHGPSDGRPAARSSSASTVDTEIKEE